MRAKDYVSSNMLEETVAGSGAVELGRRMRFAKTKAQALQLAYNGLTSQYDGQVIVGGEAMQISRVVRLALATEILGREVNSFNALTEVETAYLMGYIALSEVRNILAADAFEVYKKVVSLTTEHLGKVRAAMLSACGGFCEAHWNAEVIHLPDDAPAYIARQNGFLMAEEMHEIVPRSALPRKYQEILFHPGNCLMLSAWYHTQGPHAIHNVGWDKWGLDLLFLLRDKAQIQEFVDLIAKHVRHTEPAYLEMVRRLS